MRPRTSAVATRALSLVLSLATISARRFCRRDHPLPRRHVIAGHAGLRERRNIGQRGQARRRRHRNRTQLSGGDERQRRAEIGEHELDISGDQIVQRRRRAVIGHVRHLDPRHIGKHGGGQVMESADAAGAVAQRPLFGERDEIVDAVHRQRRADDQHERHRSNDRHQRHILGRIVRQLFVERRVDRERRHRHHDRVAVGRRLRHKVGRDHRAFPGTVLDREGLIELLLKFVAEHACERVGAAAARERHDERHRMGRVLFGVLRVGQFGRHGRAARQRAMCDATAFSLLLRLHSEAVCVALDVAIAPDRAIPECRGSFQPIGRKGQRHVAASVVSLTTYVYSSGAF